MAPIKNIEKGGSGGDMVVCWLLCFSITSLFKFGAFDVFPVGVSGVILPKTFHLMFLKIYGVHHC